MLWSHKLSEKGYSTLHTSNHFYQVTTQGGDLSREAWREETGSSFFSFHFLHEWSWVQALVCFCLLSLLFLSSVPCLTLDISSPYRSVSIGGKQREEKIQWRRNEKQLLRHPVMLHAAKEKVVIAFTRRTLNASLYFPSTSPCVG